MSILSNKAMIGSINVTDVRVMKPRYRYNWKRKEWVRVKPSDFSLDLCNKVKACKSAEECDKLIGGHFGLSIPKHNYRGFRFW